MTQRISKETPDTEILDHEIVRLEEEIEALRADLDEALAKIARLEEELGDSQKEAQDAQDEVNWLEGQQCPDEEEHGALNDARKVLRSIIVRSARFLPTSPYIPGRGDPEKYQEYYEALEEIEVLAREAREIYG